MDNQLSNQQIQSKAELQDLQSKAALNSTVVRQILIIQVIDTVAFLFNVLYLQYLCMIQKVCGMDGIESILILQQSLFGFIFFTLIFLGIIYQAVQNIKHSWVVWIKWPLLLYSASMVIFSVIAFSYSANYSRNDIQTIWNTLTPIGKEWYNNDPQQLLDINIKNMWQIGVMHGISGLILILLFFLLFNFQYIMIQDKEWRPPLQVRTSFEKSLLIRDLIRMKKLKNDENKLIQDEQKQSQTDEVTKSIFQPSRFQKRQAQPPPLIEEEQEPLQSSQVQNRNNPFNLSPEKDNSQIQKPQLSQINRPIF